LIETALRLAPEVLIDTDCEELVNETDMEPDKPPPLIASLRLPLDARPEAEPEALNDLSSQLPETPPSR
jgi:hypothetical protein